MSAFPFIMSSRPPFQPVTISYAKIAVTGRTEARAPIPAPIIPCLSDWPSDFQDMGRTESSKKGKAGIKTIKYGAKPPMVKLIRTIKKAAAIKM